MTVEINLRFTATVEASDTTAARYAAIRNAKQALEAVPGVSGLSCSDWKVSEAQSGPVAAACFNLEPVVAQEDVDVVRTFMTTLRATTPADAAGALLSKAMSRFVLEGNPTQSRAWLVQHNSPNRAQRRAAKK